MTIMEPTPMNPEDREALIARAALGALSGDDIPAWARLVRHEPEAAREMESLQSVADVLRVLAPPPKAPAAADRPLPAKVLVRLEEARLQQRPEPEIRAVSATPPPRRPAAPVPESLWMRMNQWLADHLWSPGPLAALGVLAVLGVFLLRQDGEQSPVRADSTRDVKSVALADFPLASPGAETRLTDPAFLWISLSPEKARVRVELSGTLIAEADGLTAPVPWGGLRASPAGPSSRSAPPLTPGQRYQVTVILGGETVSREVLVRDDAKPLAAWTALPEAEDQVRQWLKENPADALTLATALAKSKTASPELTALRREALRAALEQAGTKSSPSTP